MRKTPFSTLGTMLSWVMIVGIAWVVPAAVIKGDFPVALMAAVAVVLSLFPAFLRRNVRVTFPWGLEFLILLQLYLHTFWGTWMQFYSEHWFWDKLLHFKGTMIVSMLGFFAIYSLHVAGRVRLSGPLVGLFTVIFGNALGAWWEIAEYSVDKAWGLRTQYGLEDTMIDLINNLAGSLVAAVLGWLYVKFADPQTRGRVAMSLARVLSPIFAGYLPGAGKNFNRPMEGSRRPIKEKRSSPIPPPLMQCEVETESHKTKPGKSPRCLPGKTTVEQWVRHLMPEKPKSH